uniref:Cnidarian restricted protein n=1 Tax=Clytia hemisphaerica TaxID=252671 RepID=A0A7M5V4T6_9CNID
MFKHYIKVLWIYTLSFGFDVIAEETKCILLKQSCLDKECGNCLQLSTQGKFNQAVRLCGNSSFTSCLIENCLKDNTDCVHVQQDREVGGIDKTIVITSSVACFTLLVVVFLFFYRFVNRTSLSRTKNKKVVNLEQKEEIFDTPIKMRDIEEGCVENVPIKSIWSNVYITKLEDYETSEDEN